MVLSELGAGALAGRHGGRDELFTEEFQSAVYERQIAEIRGQQAVKRMSPWVLFDFRSPRRQNACQRGYNRKGLLDFDRSRRKLAFYTLKAFYAELAASE